MGTPRKTASERSFRTRSTSPKGNQMASSTQASGQDSLGEADSPASGSRKKVTMIAVAVLALVAGWYFFMGPGAAADEAIAEETHAGEVMELEAITMNLADGRLLKLGLALQLVSEPQEAEVTGALALDEAISYLGEHTYEQLAAPSARASVQAELSRRVSERYHQDVLEVYFTEFVMQ